MNAISNSLRSAIVVLLMVFVGKAINGAETSESPVGLFLAKHCYDCHSGSEAEAGLDLESVVFALSDAEVRRRWIHLYDRVATGEMPPASADKPDADAKTAFIDSLGDSLTRADLASREVVLRRLNRSEYENTVRDMFGIYVDVQRLLPDDAAEQGFDTTAATLSLSAEQLVLYVKAADLVLDRVFGPASKPRTLKKTVNFATLPRGTGKSERKLSDGVVLFSSAKHLPLYDANLPEPGLYRVRMKVKAEQSDRPVVMHVNGGNTGAIAAHTAGFFEAPPDKVTTVEFTDRALERSDCFAIGMIGGYPWWSVDEKTYQGAGLFIGDISIEGPIEPWPPESRSQLLGNIDPAQGSLNDIREILALQLPRAFRRETDAAEVEPFVALAKAALDEGMPFESALRRGLKGILCAPEFLFLEERLDDSGTTIDNFALASRLSYLLWSSLPDKQLMALAKRGDLHKPDVLRAQVEQMLADDKSNRFIERFTGQWLRLDDIDFTVPDNLLYPEYNQLLRQSMLEETHAFFREVLQRNLSVRNFVDSDFATINEPLADFYGVDGVEGLQIRRVELPDDSLRGGVLTQASVLKVSADGTRTSPVLRGAWILKHFYGTPSPPPPPSVEAIEPDIRGATTIREQLAKHREHESCIRCHRRIDPPGFALESFDVIGAQRDWYRTRGSGKFVRRLKHPQNSRAFVRYRQGPDVDTSGRMSDGREFADIREYKLLLLEDETAMPIALTRLLLTYALGRPLGFSDRPEVERIVAEVEADDYGLRSLLHEVVQSELFHKP